MKIKKLLLMFLTLALSQKTSAHDLDLKPTAKTIRITQRDVTSPAEEKNMLTFGAAGLILGICNRRAFKRNKQADIASIATMSLIGLGFAAIKDIHTGHGFKNTTAFGAGRLAGGNPGLLLETSLCLIAGRAIGATLDNLANDASNPTRFEALGMKNGAILGAVFGAANTKKEKDICYVGLVGYTSYKLINYLTKRPL